MDWPPDVRVVKPLNFTLWNEEAEIRRFSGLFDGSPRETTQTLRILRIAMRLALQRGLNHRSDEIFQLAIEELPSAALTPASTTASPTKRPRRFATFFSNSPPPARVTISHDCAATTICKGMRTIPRNSCQRFTIPNRACQREHASVD